MSKALNKLKKLVNQKRGEEALGNFEAALAFELKINELLIKHKLELSDVERAEEDKANPLVTKTVEPQAWGEERLPKRVAWTEGLADIIARHYFCKGLALLESNAVLFVGRAADTEIAAGVFCRLMRTGLNICETELAVRVLEYTRPGSLNFFLLPPPSASHFRYSFFCGFNSTIMARLNAQRERHTLNAGSQTTLMRCEKEVEDYVNDELRPSKEDINEEFKAPDRDTFWLGMEKGREVSLDPEETKRLNE